MADNIKPTFAKSDVKSGVTLDVYAEKVLDGLPPKKGVEQIEKESCPKTSPGSIRAKS
jgi:hypothetical protein